MGAASKGADGVRRCPWGNSSEEMAYYHDNEWGRQVRTDEGLYERMMLEAFQSGLSWSTILRKRENFRSAFDGFAIEAVAAYGPKERERLLADAGIVRNRAKIDAAIQNAKAALELEDGLAKLLWSYAPDVRRIPVDDTDVPATTPESKAMARDLKKRGFAFVGPTTSYALMQATGMVNDHLKGCAAR